MPSLIHTGEDEGDRGECKREIQINKHLGRPMTIGDSWAKRSTSTLYGITAIVSILLVQAYVHNKTQLLFVHPWWIKRVRLRSMLSKHNHYICVVRVKRNAPHAPPFTLKYAKQCVHTDTTLRHRSVRDIDNWRDSGTWLMPWARLRMSLFSINTFSLPRSRLIGIAVGCVCLQMCIRDSAWTHYLIWNQIYLKCSQTLGILTAVEISFLNHIFVCTSCKW